MKLGNAVSLFFTAFTGGFYYRYCPVWDKALNNLMEKGTLLEVKNGVALFEYDTKLYEVFACGGFDYFGHLVGLNTTEVDESAMRRPSFRCMDKLQRMVKAEKERVAKKKEQEMRVIMRSLLTEQNEGHNSSL
ncbi:hypothetical protein KY539_003049 [Salmonella enterica]|nr:hypothetical protein [Salmonella enterica]